MNGEIKYDLSGTISNLKNALPDSSELSILNDLMSELESISEKHDGFLGNILGSDALNKKINAANSSYVTFIASLGEFQALWNGVDVVDSGLKVDSSGKSSKGSSSRNIGVSQKSSGGGSSLGSVKKSSGSGNKVTAEIHTSSLDGMIAGSFKSAVPVSSAAGVVGANVVRDVVSKINPVLENPNTEDKDNVSNGNGDSGSSSNATTDDKIANTPNTSNNVNGISNSSSSSELNEKNTEKKVVSNDKNSVKEKSSTNKNSGFFKNLSNLSGLSKLSSEKISDGLTSIAGSSDTIKSLGDTLIESGKNGLEKSGVLNLGTIKTGQAISTAKGASVLPAALLALLSGGATAGGGYVLTKKKANASDNNLDIDEYQE